MDNRKKVYDQSLSNLSSFLDDSSFKESHHLDGADERYVEKEFVAQGGMKRVYRVHDNMTGRVVAMAMIRELKHENMFEHFIHEAQLNASLEHPHIMPVYDAGLDELGQPFFTMKWIEGQSLADVLKEFSDGEVNYSLAELLDIFMKVCDAVSYAHDKNILHLDLKPENIQLGKFGEVLVSDWGLARFRDKKEFSRSGESDSSSSLLTQSGAVSGTPGFMSPEQISMSRSELDERADIFSLGAVLYNILSCKVPFVGGSSHSVMNATVEGKLLKPSQANLGNAVPSALEAVCLKSMAHDRESRYRSVENLKADIQSFRRGYATVAEEASFLRMLSLLLKRHSSISIALVASLLILLSSAFYFVMEIKESENVALQNEKRAKLKESEALRNAQLAEENLRRFIDEKLKLNEEKQRTLSTRESLKALFEQFQKLNITGRLSQSNKLNLAELGLWEQKAYEELAQLDFSEALKAFERVENKRAKSYKVLLKDLVMMKKPEYLASEAFFLLGERLIEDELRSTAMQLFMSTRSIAQQENSRKGLCVNLLRRLNPNCESVVLKLESLSNGNVMVDLSQTRGLSEILPLFLYSVESLDISYNQVKSTDEIALLPLKFLNLSGSGVQRLESLKGTPLKSLDISGTNLADLSDFTHPTLSSIKLPDETLADFAFLRNCPSLKELKISRFSKNLRALFLQNLPDEVLIRLE